MSSTSFCSNNTKMFKVFVKSLKYDPKTDYFKFKSYVPHLLQNLLRTCTKRGGVFYPLSYGNNSPHALYVLGKHDSTLFTFPGAYAPNPVKILGIVPMNVLAFLGYAWKLKCEEEKNILRGNFIGVSIDRDQFTKKTIESLVKLDFIESLRKLKELEELKKLESSK